MSDIDNALRDLRHLYEQMIVGYVRDAVTIDAALDECARLRALLAEACREWSRASAPEWTDTHGRIAEIRKEGDIK